MLKFGGCASMASCTRGARLQHSTTRIRMQYNCQMMHEWTSIACEHTFRSKCLFIWHRKNDSMCQNWYMCLLHHADTHNAERISHAYLNAADTETWMCRVCPNITMCVRNSVGSRNRTIHNACHISLHVSSMTEPTHQSQHVCSANYLKMQITANTHARLLKQTEHFVTLPYNNFCCVWWMSPQPQRSLFNQKEIMWSRWSS